DPNNKRSPYQRILAALQETMLENGERRKKERMSYELRMLGCLVRANIRDKVRHFSKQLTDAAARQVTNLVHINELRADLNAFFSDLERFFAAFRDLRKDFLEPAHTEHLRQVYQYVDEFLSVSAESHLTLLIEDIDASETLK